MERALLYMLKRYEDKLNELIGKEKSKQFAIMISQDAIRHEVECMEPGDFKAFCLQNIDKILGESEDA